MTCVGGDAPYELVIGLFAAAVASWAESIVELAGPLPRDSKVIADGEEAGNPNSAHRGFSVGLPGPFPGCLGGQGFGPVRFAGHEIS